MFEPKRQHPLWMIILFVNRFKPFVLPFIFIFILNSNSLQSIIIYAGSLILLFTVYNIIISIFEWRNFTYFVTNNNIEISDGKLIVKKRYITLNKIQSIQEDDEELNELLKREVETNIVNDNEHTLKEDQKTTHHYSMSFKEILLISITSLYFLAFIPLAISGYVRLDELFEIDQYTDTVV